MVARPPTEASIHEFASCIADRRTDRHRSRRCDRLRAGGRRLVDRTVERFGRLDAAVNNAGTEGHPGPVIEQTAESYAATFDTTRCSA
jgi:NAD(P)-dependent dehydrogenase (short-subunit alcohol dehydrogenase family)